MNENDRPALASQPNPGEQISREGKTIDYPAEVRRASQHGRSWPMLVALIIAALAFAIIVAVSGRWAYHHWHKQTLAPASTQDLPTPPPANLQSGQ